MQDIMAKLQEILSTKEGQDQLNNIANMLNPQPTLQAEAPPQPNKGFDLSSLAAMFAPPQNVQNVQNLQAEQCSAAPPVINENPLGGIDINMIMNLQKIMSGMSGANGGDKNTQLLLALKPHFSEKRQEKVDKALGIMKLVSLLPLLKESGILKGLL